LPQPSRISVYLPKILVGTALMALHWLLRLPNVSRRRRLTILLDAPPISAMLLLFLFLGAAPVQPLSMSSPTQARGIGSQATKNQAQAETAIGQTDLREGRPHDAQVHCEAAVKLDPTDKAANECLDKAAAMFVDQDLNEADAKLLSGDKKGAINLASKWAAGGT